MEGNGVRRTARNPCGHLMRHQHSWKGKARNRIDTENLKTPVGLKTAHPQDTAWTVMTKNTPRDSAQLHRAQQGPRDAQASTCVML